MRVRNKDPTVQHPKPDNALDQRVADFLQSQIAWYRHVLDHLTDLDPRLDKEDFDELDAERDTFDRDIARQDIQLKQLLIEWRSAPKPPPKELERIRRLARQAEELAGAVAAELDRASHRTGARAQQVRQGLLNLRTGRQIFSRYRQDTGNDAGVIDETI